MKKRLFSLALALCLCMGLCVPALAYNDTGTVGQASTLVCGYDNVLVIDSNNTLWMWGYGGEEFFGGADVGEAIFYETPRKIMDNVSSVSISNSEYSSYAAVIKTDGSLWTWGFNDCGQLGNGESQRAYQTEPQKIMDNVAAVSCGYDHTAAIKTDGSLWVWGRNTYGEVGNGRLGLGEIQTTPVKVMDGVSAVSCGTLHYTAAVKTDGTLWMWGSAGGNQFNNGGKSNDVFQLMGYDYPCQTVPIKVMDNVASVYCGGDNSTFVLQTDGTLVTWPINIEPGNTPQPLEVIARDVISVSVGPGYPVWGDNNVAYIKKDGSLWVYGANRYCQLGDPEKDDTTYEDPSKVLDDVVAVMVDNYDAIIAMKSDGSLWMWGTVSSIGNGVEGDYDRSLRDINGRNFTVRCQSTPLRVTNITGKVPISNNAPAPSVPAVGGFTDVSANAYYADAVVWAADNGYIQGYNGKFSPNDPLTRGAVFTILARMDDADTEGGSTWYEKGMNWAVENGVSDGTNPTSAVTLEGLVTMLYRYENKPDADTSVLARFSDSSSVHTWTDCQEAMAWAVETGLVQGSDGKLDPLSTLARSRGAVVLQRYCNIILGEE